MPSNCFSEHLQQQALFDALRTKGVRFSHSTYNSRHYLMPLDCTPTLLVLTYNSRYYCLRHTKSSGMLSIPATAGIFCCHMMHLDRERPCVSRRTYNSRHYMMHLEPYLVIMHNKIITIFAVLSRFVDSLQIQVAGLGWAGKNGHVRPAFAGHPGPSSSGSVYYCFNFYSVHFISFHVIVPFGYMYTFFAEILRPLSSTICITPFSQVHVQLT